MLAESFATSSPPFESAQFSIFGSESHNIDDLIKDLLDRKQQDSHDKYLSFKGVMQIHGYAWDAFKVQTEDGYTLTTFRVTGKV